MPEEKSRINLRIPYITHELVKLHYPKDNCNSQNEFIEKAINFYIAYLQAEDISPYLSEILGEILRGNICESEERVRRMLFKVAAELGVLTRIIASYEKLEPSTFSRIRGAVIEELKRTNGTLRLEDAFNKQLRGLL